jgi:hypothetical protein
MIEVLIDQPEQESRDLWAEPYGEYRILAGHLRGEDVAKVYPASQCWPEEVNNRARALTGSAKSVPSRLEAGQCRLFPVEEPEALAILEGVSQMLPFGPDVPVSYSWVEISNLIATAAVAEPLPREATVFNNTPQSLAQYSLFGAAPNYKFGPNGALYLSTGVNVQPIHRAIEGDQLVVRYQLSQLPRPILVGYEQERCFLLNAYSRVLQALIGGVERLLCLVYYGLDLTAPQLGVRVLDPKGGAVNHFGRASLLGEHPPMVKDFLDPNLSVLFPARSPFFMVLPSVQTHQVQFTPPPSVGLPLSFDAEVDLPEQPGQSGY